MKKLDLLRLRKMVGLSQREMARQLGVQASFLSAIENGRSRFPEEKIDKLKEVVGLDDISDFMIGDREETPVVPPHTHALDESDSLSQLLRHIHKLAHQTDNASHELETGLRDRIDYLTARNDRLSDRLDQLLDEVNRLREENYNLKLQLLQK